jgi:frataxin
MRPYSQQIHGQSFIKPFPRTLRTSTASTRSFSRTSTTCESKLPNIDSDTVVPASISIEQYHQISDEYMDAVVAKLEELQEAREDVDVEYSVQPFFPTPFDHN